MKRIGVAVSPVLLLSVLSAHGVAPLVVHEWGTITTRHAADGTPEGRLNRIDPAEALPNFVHRYEPSVTQRDSQRMLLKSPVTPGRPDVTMRLETPVIYFHPATSGRQPPFEVSVRFRGGVINEFYPNADAAVEIDAERINAKIAAGVIKSWDGDILNNYVVGSLRWPQIRLQEGIAPPATTSRVWLAPRHVQSKSVRTSAGEAEQYLFYRGVAHLDALVQTGLFAGGVRLRAPERLHWMRDASMTIPRLWLVDVRANNTSAFHEHAPIMIQKNAPSRELDVLPLFAEKEYTRASRSALRQSLKQSLLAQGLFEDEAEAMLETWAHSYFNTPGLRIFYVVPTEWIEYYLPLRVSVPHKLTRVLIGRIDLIR